MTPVSVVIICCNAAATIEEVLRSAFALTDDVIVVDSGSTDGTQNLVSAPAKLITTGWMGYGATKNKGSSEARYDWIMSIDADEVMNDELIEAIRKINFGAIHCLYAIKRLNYLGGQPIYYGEWQNDWVKRLFNRRVVAWDTSLVHENLIFNEAGSLKKLDGLLHHYTTPTIEAYEHKLENYAALMAQKYFNQGKKAQWYHPYVSPLFGFIKNYIVHLGIMDKKAGWQIAKAHAFYTLNKYKKLKGLYTVAKK